MHSILIPLLALQAAFPTSRNAAVEALEGLRQKNPVSSALERVAEPIRKGDASSGDQATADRYYRLAIIEAEILSGEGRRVESRPSSPAPPAADPDDDQGDSGVPFGTIVSAETLYTVARGDTLQKIARRFGVSSDTLARKNGLHAGTPLAEGKRLRVATRRIAPKVLRDGIIVNIPERMLYYYRNGELRITAPVSLGKPKGAPGGGWETPTGEFRITGRVKDPVWNVPKSIREDMALKGAAAVAQVPPGPTNPLGKYALKTSIPRILIHGTNSPGSIYRFSSHGCIRVGGREMEALYRLVPLETPGEIIYEPVKVATTGDGRVYLEVHRDVYRKVQNLEDDVRRLLSSLNLEDAVDWRKVKRAVTSRTGTMDEVSHAPPRSAGLP